MQENTNQKLSELPWMGYFRTSEQGLILMKSALVKGDKIGALNPFGDLIWVDKNAKVIIVH